MVSPSFNRDFLRNLRVMVGVRPHFASRHDLYLALALTVRERLLEQWHDSIEIISSQSIRSVCYLSAEFLIGRQLGNNLRALGVWEEAREVIAPFGVSLESVMQQEAEPALGNGGLGRLAACFLESLSTLSIPAFGYGLRYEFGIFQQEIVDGWQDERPDDWLVLGNPWEIARSDRAVEVGFGGVVERSSDSHDRANWIPGETVKGVPYDNLIPGYETRVVNTLRLWNAKAPITLDFHRFNSGDYLGAEAPRIVAEALSKVLYPSDSTPQGRELRLRQEYFLVSCSLQDIIRACKRFGISVTRLPEVAAIQLNDTHPSLAVPELLRLLVDIEGMPFAVAWDVVTKTFSFTNHTLLPEALERWPRVLMERILPRHMELIFAINQRFLDHVAARYPGDDARLSRLSIIEEGEEQQVRMAHLAAIGSHTINGVAELHSSLVKKDLFPDLFELTPERFQNKTNGVAHRRWMLLGNPRISSLISERIGTGWLTDAERLRELEPAIHDEDFRYRWLLAKRENKRELARIIFEKCGVDANPDSMFDIHAKRFHEYKRQLLKLLHVISLYHAIKEHQVADPVPRIVIFSGKAAPSYWVAKLIIKLIHSVAEVINCDAEVGDMLRVAFLPDLSVSMAQTIYAGADLSEQISTAGKEASGTGNMKFALNGALTIGTLDGANIEIREAVGQEHFFLFGNTVESLQQLRNASYDPRSIVAGNEALRLVLGSLVSGEFARGDQRLFEPLVAGLLDRDEYFVCADFASYLDAQDEVEHAYNDQDRWTRSSILNVARCGKFSSDRTIAEYARDIWRVGPIAIAESTDSCGKDEDSFLEDRVLLD